MQLLAARCFLPLRRRLTLPLLPLATGLTPRIVKVAPACAIMISTYEFFKQFFRERNAAARAASAAE